MLAMLARVRKQIDAEGLLAPGDRIVVGVSGGVDSTALLHVLWSLNREYAYGWTLHAVHLNHGFRGEEARQDADYVKQVCDQLQITCHLFAENVSLYMKEHGIGAQEAGRERRYDLYRQVARQVGAAKVAVGHHADDQVETILFRMLRGTGLHGLSGMPARRWLIPGEVEIVRPLLVAYRDDLEAYCQQVGLSPRLDQSNLSRKYKRNKLRLDVLPHLAEINPRYREHLLQLASLAEADDAFLNRLSDDQLEQVITARETSQIVIDGKKFRSCDLALQRRMIPLILSYLSTLTDWSSQHVEAVLRVICGDHPSAVVHLPDDLVVKRVYQYIHFVRERRTEPTEVNYCYELAVPGRIWIEECRAYLAAEWRTEAPDWERLTAFDAVFDADLVAGSRLLVRNRRRGDRIALLGVSGTKKLKNLLIDYKVPRAWRDRLPLVVADDRIIWVPGVRRSRHGLVGEQTTQYIWLHTEFAEEWQEVFLE
ncbi:tRNA lysidine(34) synthetase TilS [Brevibacillus humidisoli]|uniref:tRNA lysidine(34) synthetase TilS n=1 Tax=Brevibacillus humidisoli TaxID=2895522 RepID=UPI0030B9B6EA